jgi:hypothetical protein
MALFFYNKLVLVPDYLKISTRYSSQQSFWRAKKKGLIQPIAIGGLQFMEATPDQVAMLYDTVGLDCFATVSPSQNLAGLVLLSYASKAAGVNDAKILIWGITQRLDVYWIGGKLFADMQNVLRLAAAEKGQAVAAQLLRVKPKPRKRHR